MSAANGSTIVLAFPPLVAGNLGHYYPSTAVLAGALTARGYRTRQLELNESLASTCLDPGALVLAGEGALIDGTRGAPDLPPSIAARVLLRSAATGRLPKTATERLRTALLEPLRIDEPVERLVPAEFMNTPAARFYRRFFESDASLGDALASAALVGITVPMGPQLGPTLILSEVIRARFPDLPIVVGGPTFSLMAEPLLDLILRRFPISAIVRYDGEAPLLQLVDQRMRGTWEPWNVPGASSIAPTGDTVHRSPGRGLGLDELAFAEYDPSVVAMMKDPELAVVQARGCYWGRCAYCDYVELYEGSPRYRTRTAARFVDELEYQIARHGVRRYAVISEALPPAFARRAAREILDRGVQARWYSFAMVDKGFTAETFELLARAGCEQLIIGLETMTDRVLQLVQKAATGAANREFLIKARDAGVRLCINLIPDLPTTTFDEAAQTLREMQELRSCLTHVSVFPFEATVSSRIGRCPSDFGLTSAASSPAGAQAQFASNHLAARDLAMTDDERSRTHDAYRAFANEVNIASELATLGMPDGELTPDTPLRIVDEVLDTLPEGDGVLYFHCLTSDHVRLSHQWHGVIEWLRERQPFTRREVEDWLSVEQSDMIFQRLLAFRCVAIARPERAETAASVASFR
jgi:hypothetical protein